MQSNGLNSQAAENESMILEEEIDETYEPTKEGSYLVVLICLTSKFRDP